MIGIQSSESVMHETDLQQKQLIEKLAQLTEKAHRLTRSIERGETLSHAKVKEVQKGKE